MLYIAIATAIGFKSTTLGYLSLRYPRKNHFVFYLCIYRNKLLTCVPQTLHFYLAFMNLSKIIKFRFSLLLFFILKRNLCLQIALNTIHIELRVLLEFLTGFKLIKLVDDTE